MKQLTLCELYLLLIEKKELSTTITSPVYIGGQTIKFSAIKGTPVSSKTSLIGKIHNPNEVILSLDFNKEAFAVNIEIYDKIPAKNLGEKWQFCAEYLLEACNILIREKSSMISYIVVGYNRETGFLTTEDFTIEQSSSDYKLDELVDKLRTL